METNKQVFLYTLVLFSSIHFMPRNSIFYRIRPSFKTYRVDKIFKVFHNKSHTAGQTYGNEGKMRQANMAHIQQTCMNCCHGNAIYRWKAKIESCSIMYDVVYHFDNFLTFFLYQCVDWPKAYIYASRTTKYLPQFRELIYINGDYLFLNV